MSPSYPEIADDYARIERVAVTEENAFLKTIASGSKLFETAAEKTRADGSTQVSGSTAFLLHDTQGFPLDLTLEMAAEAGLTVDTAEFDRLMQEQRSRAARTPRHARAASRTSPSTGSCWTPGRPSSPATPSWSPRAPSAG